MDINKLTLGQIKEIQAQVGAQKESRDDSHWIVGKPYFIRTVTHHLTGRLIKVTKLELVLEDAAWIADDGRFHEAIKSGNFSEVEPYPDGAQVIVGRGSLIDATSIQTTPRSANDCGSCGAGLDRKHEHEREHDQEREQERELTRRMWKINNYDRRTDKPRNRGK